MAERIGGQNFYSYFEAFGFTSKTGIDLPGEAVGQYQSYSSFTNVSLAVYSFGQTFTTTALQQITAVSAVANGGYLVKPHVVSSLVDDDGNVVADFSDSVKYQVVSSDICDDIADVLEQGVSGDGGARNARVNGYKIAAKTGTSEKRDKLNEEGETQYVVCSTVAFAPADDPQVAVLVMVDEPQGENLFGSYIAAPFVANIMEEILPYLGVERTTLETSVTVADFVGSEVSRAKSDVDVLGLEAVIVGEGSTVTAQIPAAGSRVEQGGTVVLYTGTAVPEDTVVVPDLSELTAYQATRKLSELGLNVYISGSDDNTSYVYSQSVDANTMVPIGTVVTIDLMYMTGLTD
ncbi:MAG: PASTA domain-containing protein [Clostridia bacterium]|nr:PASTA domain-containing protein [Clostridia bacterium]